MFANARGGGRQGRQAAQPVIRPGGICQDPTGGNSPVFVGRLSAVSREADITASGAAAYLGNDIIPMIHSQRLRTEQNPTICFTGTSIGLYQGTGLIPQATTQGLIWRTILAANPTKKFCRLDRAIGG